MNRATTSRPAVLPRAAAMLLCVLLSGCGSGSNGPGNPNDPPPPQGPVAGVSFQGVVLKGAVKVDAATVQLYAAGTSVNGSASTALLSSPLTTESDGSFTVPSTFSCADKSTILFLLVKGGDSSQGNTDSSWLVAPVGRCGDLSSNTFITVDELTTVAFTYAFAPFLAPGGNLGASSTNIVGLTNALMTAQTLVNTSTGAFLGANRPTNVTVPVAKLDALAGLLTPCAEGVDCATLFSLTTVAGQAPPTNTLDAMLNIARHPANNVGAIYTLSSLRGGFVPTLTTAPPDWTIAITLTGGGLSGPTSIAIDGTGNVWSANDGTALSAFAPGGAPVFANGITGSGLEESFGIAIDTKNNVWVTNDPSGGISGGSVTEFSNSGQPLSTAGYIAGGINYPLALAADSTGSLWVANYGDSAVTLLNSSGVCNGSTCGLASAAIDFPDAIAVDANHNAWVASESSNLAKVSPDGTQITSINCCYGADGIAIDSGGYLWTSNYYSNSVSLVTSSGSLISSFTGGGLSQPHTIAVDGAGNVWVANFASNSITELSGSTSTTPGTILAPASGFGGDAGLDEPYGLAIDASGNVWVSNFDATPTPGQQGTLTQFVGLATPVKTPLLGPVSLP
jgi:sugar lactone lactonase YvrE